MTKLFDPTGKHVPNAKWLDCLVLTLVGVTLSLMARLGSPRRGANPALDERALGSSFPGPSPKQHFLFAQLHLRPQAPWLSLQLSAALCGAQAFDAAAELVG